MRVALLIASGRWKGRVWGGCVWLPVFGGRKNRRNGVERSGGGEEARMQGGKAQLGAGPNRAEGSGMQPGPAASTSAPFRQ